MAASPNLPNLHALASLDSGLGSEGFAIRLPSAQLADLIQINCLNRIRGAFRVSSAGRDGYLYFEGGQLIHAEFSAITGLDAVVQMLGWKGGSIEPCVTTWPRESTIDMGADALLLCAAQRLDELPQRPSAIPEDLTTKVVRRVEITAEARDSRPSVVPSREQLSHLEIAQLNSGGVVLQLKSGATLDLADTAFFSLRMAQAIGETLGIGNCRALFLEGEVDGVAVLKGRSVVATRGAKTDLAFILERVGLVPP